jgi:hypothetical protein
MAKVDDLFKVAKGKGGYIRDYESGVTPLVSATSLDNGVAGLVNAMPEFKAPAITVERVTGSAFVQLVDFSSVPDDVSILIPKQDMELNALYVVASIINSSKWRFSFARKLTPTRLKRLELPDFESIHVPKVDDFIPKTSVMTATPSLPDTTFNSIPLVSLFVIKSGDFHKAEDLPVGSIPLVSCGDANNGIMRFCSVPEKYIYQNALTVAYNGRPLLTKYHPYRFAAKDDVAVLIPKKPVPLATLLFTQIMLIREMWRYSYGRKCFREKLSKMCLLFPQKNGEIDKEFIQQVVSNTSYWKFFTEIVGSPLESIQSKTQLPFSDF